jgi:phage terminase large subunit-like protein
MREWDKAANTAIRPIEKGWGCYGGLDLASISDLTALVLAFRQDDGSYDLVCRFWCPEQGIDTRSRIDGVPYQQWVREGYLIPTNGDVTDYTAVEAELESLAEQYGIGEIAYDRWNASQLVNNLQSAGANMTPVSQTYAGLSAPWREVERLVLEGMLRHGGNPILRWMAENVELEMDPWGNVRPSKRKSSDRIDGMVALTMAIGRWLAWGESPGMGYAV